MKKLIIFVVAVFAVLAMAADGYCAIRWVSSSHCSRGGYYRDTSNDGNPYNNANYLGYNN